MEFKITIPGSFPGINEYTKACRSSPMVGNRMKKRWENRAVSFIWDQMRSLRPRPPVRIHYKFYEPNRRRDHDNVSGFAHKVIQDALVVCKYLEGDGWNYIVGYSDDFYHDKAKPRIEIIIEEVEE